VLSPEKQDQKLLTEIFNSFPPMADVLGAASMKSVIEMVLYLFYSYSILYHI